MIDALEQPGRTVDYGAMRFVDHDGQSCVRPFLNAASAGVTGHIVARVLQAPTELLWRGIPTESSASSLPMPPALRPEACLVAKQPREEVLPLSSQISNAVC